MKIILLRVIPAMTFCLNIYSGILSGIQSGIYSNILSSILSDIYSGILSDIHSGILSRKYFGILFGIYLGSLFGGRIPAVHTAIGPWRMRPSGAHCDRTLADEVQQCTLRFDPGA